MTLQFLAVGTGRDGTVSLTQTITDIFRLNGIGGTVAHEYLARDCYDTYCLFKETGEAAMLDELRIKIAACPYQAIVGNGYASVLPLFKEAFPHLAIIHLKRRDRSAVINSHLKNSILFPESYVYYGADHAGMRRVAAFHEGEMSKQQWDSTSIEERFGWFYDYTHRTVRSYLHNFPRHMEIATESLSTRSALTSLVEFILDRHGVTPSPVHLNRHAYLTVDDFSEHGRPYAQWLFGKLAAGDIERDPVYLSDYVTNQYIAFTGYQITGFISEVAPAYAYSHDLIKQSLERFESLLLKRLDEVRRLKADLRAGSRS